MFVQEGNKECGPLRLYEPSMELMNVTSKTFLYYVLSPIALKLFQATSQVLNKCNKIASLNVCVGSERKRA